MRHVRDLRVAGLELVEVPDREASATLADLRDADGVRWAQADPTAHAFGLAADPYLPLEWGLAAIGAPGAWAVADGRGTTVGVVDTGVDAAHPDLAGQLDPRGAVTDPNGHGTHVAGVVAAATSNGVGVAGVAPGARVLAMQALGADGSGPMSGVADAEDRAADLGARVINLSLGSEGPSLAERTVIRAHPGRALRGGLRQPGARRRRPADLPVRVRRAERPVRRGRGRAPAASPRSRTGARAPSTCSRPASTSPRPGPAAPTATPTGPPWPRPSPRPPPPPCSAATRR